MGRICTPPLLLAEPLSFADPQYTCSAATKEPRLPLAAGGLGLDAALSDSLPRLAAVVFPARPPFVRTPHFILVPVLSIVVATDKITETFYTVAFERWPVLKTWV